jgi:CPA2 family monovalent cation:H+ antiporter-2
VVKDWAHVLAVLAIIIVGKSVAAYAIVRVFGHSHATALTISASLAQIGEFSFILAGLGVSLALMPERGRDLILAGAILSIVINPFLFVLLDRILVKPGAAKSDATKPDSASAAGADGPREPVPVTALTGHIVLVGHGRVGGFISETMRPSGVPMLVIDSDPSHIEQARQQGLEAIAGNAADPEIVAAANLPAARCLLVAIPDAFEGGQVVDQGRKLNPDLVIVARAHSAAEIEHLNKHGATTVVVSEHETAKAMIAGIPSMP